MIVLGVDPGPKESAWVVWDGNRIRDHNYMLNESVLEIVTRPPLAWLEKPVIVIEWIEGYGLTVGRETFDTCRWVGRFEQAAGGCHLLGRKAVKSHLCSTTQAKDTHIRQALIDKIGEPGTKKKPGPTYGIVGDEWAALAVAVTWWETHQAA